MHGGSSPEEERADGAEDRERGETDPPAVTSRNWACSTSTAGPLLPSPTLDLDAPRMRRRCWAHLLARVFAIDVTTCPCGGRLMIVDVVLEPDAIALHLHGARAPPRVPPLGQLSLLPT
jgi:hypothetical protein